VALLPIIVAQYSQDSLVLPQYSQGLLQYCSRPAVCVLQRAFTHETCEICACHSAHALVRAYKFTCEHSYAEIFGSSALHYASLALLIGVAAGRGDGL
jgi:hypothetical protein